LTLRTTGNVLLVFAKGIGSLDELTISHVLRRGARLHLSAQPISARRARAFVRDRVATPLLDSAELVASELVTNGLLHAQSPMTLGIVSGDGCVLIAVTDRSAQRPAVHQASLSAEGGRGIALVASIARQWGVQREGSGKIVWCLIESGSSGAA
jgi:anti-sigma regulatory factor (Ser/Thr protein kinase)